MADKSRFGYGIIWDGRDALEPIYHFYSEWDAEEDAEYLAEDAAEDYHSNRDGWEVSWPIQFALFTDSGELIGKFEVDREHRPSFSASAIG